MIEKIIGFLKDPFQVRELRRVASEMDTAHAEVMHAIAAASAVVEKGTFDEISIALDVVQRAHVRFDEVITKRRTQAS